MASGDSPIIANTLGIHVLSDKVGESIIVTLPDGKWFVIDAFAGNGGSRPVIDFIDRFQLKASDCICVLLTHFHRDHYSGIVDVLARLRRSNREVPFATHSVYQAEAALLAVRKAIEREENAAPENDKQWIFDDRFHDIYELLREQFFGLSQWQSIHSSRQSAGVFPCDVITIAPPLELVNDYLDSKALQTLTAKLEKLRDPAVVARSSEVRRIRRAQRKIINNMSLALGIFSPKMRVILGADCEAKAWLRLAKNPMAANTASYVGNVLHEVALLKSPHHGSAYAWNPVLASCYDQCNWAIVTHHVQGKTKLPSLTGIRKILARGVTLAIPNRQLLSYPLTEDELTIEPAKVTIPIFVKNEPSRAEADEYGDRYSANAIRSSRDEVHWVSACFDAEGSLTSWYGGSEAVLVRARA